MILLVEDSADDTLLIRVGLERAWTNERVELMRTGEEAIAYLKGEGPYADRRAYPIPRLVLLDLKLPGMHGLEVLAWVRGQRAFAGLPVVVLTGSAFRADVQSAYDRGANSFVLKGTGDLGRNVREVARYWLNVSMAPGDVESRAEKRAE